MDLQKPKLNKEYLLKAIHNAEDYSLIFIDPEGIVLEWNVGAKRIKGYSENEILGQSFTKFYTSADLLLNKPAELLEKAIAFGHAEDKGWRVRKDNSLFWAEVMITSVYNDKQELVGFYKATRDLTENKKAADLIKKQFEEIKSKNKELEQFTYLTSHDLQEPIRTIINLSALLVEEIEGDNQKEELLQYANYISGASTRMRDLVTSLLDYSRLGKQSDLIQVNLNITVDDILCDLTTLIESTNSTVNVGKLPTVVGYGTELRLLFQNLISNGIKFRGSKNPIISISATESPEVYSFEISDNGIGIEEKNLKKIFMIFKRLHNRSDYEGSGIGLAHCEKIVEMHGGKIWAESKYGQGSTFRFELPKKPLSNEN